IGTDPRTWYSTKNFDGVATEPDGIHRCGPLPSTFSVRSLGAIYALASGESASPSLRARAVGASEFWAPNEAVFRAGFACFVERHSLGDTTSDVRRTLVIAARKLILASKSDTSW